jgi:hypothetical protein
MGVDEMKRCVSYFSEIEWWVDGRFLFLKRGDCVVKIEAQPNIIADHVCYKPRIIYPDMTKFEVFDQIMKTFGFQGMFTSSEEVIFFGEGADLHIVCKTEKVVKYTDDGGCFIVYRPKFVLEIVQQIKTS